MKKFILIGLLILSNIVFSQCPGGQIGGKNPNDDYDGDGYCNSIDQDDDNDGIVDDDECPKVTGEYNGTFGVGANSQTFCRNLEVPLSVGYSYNCGYPGAPSYEATYAVINHKSSGYWHPNWATQYGHTTGDSLDSYLAINGSLSVGIFYAQNVFLQANTKYNYGLWASCAGFPANIGIRLLDPNGVVVSDTSTGLFTIEHTWKEAPGTITPAKSGLFRLEVYNITLVASGNDFSIDDIYFYPVYGCPDFDKDGTPDYLDLDSDNDGCPDALEGGGNFQKRDVKNDTLIGGVDSFGIPKKAKGGQNVGSEFNKSIISQSCITTDTVSIKPTCPTCTIKVCPVNNEIDTNGAKTVTCGTPAGYKASAPDSRGCVTYTPIGTVRDTQFTCIVTCIKSGTACDTTHVNIIPADRKSDTIKIQSKCDTCSVKACPKLDTTGKTKSTSCGTPTGYSSIGPDVNGCYTYKPNGSVKDTQKTCIITCFKNNVCDTTFVIILPPPPSADTVYIKPSCKTCSVSACPVMDDIDTTRASVSYCFPPKGYNIEGPDKNGCYNYTPMGNIQTTQSTCIIRCQSNGRCDTTVIIIYPPKPMADTIKIIASCDKCPVKGCPTNDDINKNGKISSSSCGTPKDYTISGPDANGCFTYTPNGSVKKPEITCIISCDETGRCDTTYVVISAPPSSPDTITVVPPCYNCSVQVCPVNDDIDTTGGKTSFKGEVKGFKREGPDINGCYTYTPITLITKPDTMIVITTTPSGRTDTTVVIFKVPVIKEGTDVPGIIPNYFSPNNDGVNDAFEILPIMLAYPRATLKVYNRWGNVVYRSVGPYKNDWKGQHSNNNNPLPDGVYFYMIDLQGHEKKIKSGFVEIMR